MSNHTVSEVRAANPQGINVENDPYCIGYWARRASMQRPTSLAQREGWDDADEEIATETIDGVKGRGDVQE